MPLAQNGRGISGLIYVDEAGVPHTILLAYLGDKVVWDGHVHQTIQVPTARFSLGGLTPVVVGDAIVEVGNLPMVYFEGRVPDISAGATVSPDAAEVSFEGFAPDLHADQTIDVPTASVSFEGFAPEIQVVFGVTPPTALVSFSAFAPDILADAHVAVPAAQAYFEAFVPQVGSYAAVDAPLATMSFVGLVPDISAGVSVDVPQGMVSLTGLVPNVSAGSSVAPPLASASFEAFPPEILTSGPAFVSATPGTSSASVTVPAGGSLVVAAYNNAAGDPTVTCSGGVTLTKAASSSQVTLFYAVGVAAGTYTITNTSGGSFKSFVAGVYSGVTAVSAGTLASGSSTTPSVTPAGSGLLAVSAFRGGSIPVGTTSTGDIRGRQATTSNDLVLVDRVSAPVSLSLSSSTSWAACAVWLT